MATVAAAIECKSFEHADESRSFEKGKIEWIMMSVGNIARITLQPGWRWSEHLKPLVGTDWCESHHLQYHVSGRLHIAMQDGTEIEVGPGEVSALFSNHDAWVVGDEPVVLIDWAGVPEYARQPE